MTEPLDPTPDLFALPPEDAARPVGLIDGPPRWQEGFGAGLRVWCGPLVGWRDFGDLVLANGMVAGITRHRRRLTVSLSFDLGEHILPRAIRDMVEAEDDAAHAEADASAERPPDP